MLPRSPRARAGLAAVAVAVAVAAGSVLAAVAFQGDGDGSATGTTTTATSTSSASTADPSTTSTTAATSSTTSEPAGPPTIALEPLASLDSPSALVDLPGDGPVLVSTLAGRVLEVDLVTGSSQVVLDLSDQVSTGGERGLLGLAADPEGERLYVNHTDRGGDTDIRSWPLVDGAPAGGPGGGTVHLEIDQPYPNHNGGHLVFGPDGALWIGTGDGGSSGDPQDVARDPDELLGKMLRVVPEPAGGVRPADNPDWGGRPEIWGIGLRNPWRYSFDRETQRLWVADVGQNTTEEVSVVDADHPMADFGWDEMEGDRPFEGSPDPAFVDPVVTYGHDEGCSVTGGYVYRGEAVPSLSGWYLFADFCGGWIRGVPADAPTSPPVELVAEAGDVIAFAELSDGEVLVLTREGISRIVAG